MSTATYADLDPRKTMPPHMPRVLSREVYFKGQTIIEQGSEGFHAYYIEKGKVEVILHDGPHQIVITELEAGEIFGEMALIEHEERSATIKAVEDTTVCIISSSDIETRLMQVGDKVVSALMHVFIDRLRRSNEGQMKQYKYLAEFQDRITGLVEKAGQGIGEEQRAAFRKEADPLLQQLEALLDKYRG